MLSHMTSQLLMPSQFASSDYMHADCCIASVHGHVKHDAFGRLAIETWILWRYLSLLLSPI